MALIRNEIYQIIRNDIPLRNKIATQLGITDNSVYTYAVRKAATLQKPFVLNIIKEHTGKSDEEIFELEYNSISNN